ncbi:synaptic vesicle glycoprotein 2B-like [Stomoxys calcitrans]|uniref:synaptic vesicle glycoprotein 2B-like n=1 Tax=Stomoxys calcitrans TaxID=35570 RepID=UPI0027E238B0|nr:synaptic vesicle glycoprotein 2B-like [Stomoxys calcitrans]
MSQKDNQVATKNAATIDEALEKAHFGLFNIQIILFSGVVLNNIVLESVGISFALPVVACDLNLSYQQQGVLGAICFLGIIASSHFWGLLADTQGRKRTMKPTLLLAFIVTLISSFSVNFEMIVILRFLNGIFISAASATIYAYMGEFHCSKHRNNAILWGSLIAAFSAIFFPIIAWIFINQTWSFEIPLLGITYRPWRLYFVICGIPGFICGILFKFLPESPKYLLGMDRPSEALDILKYMHHKNTKGKNKLKNDVYEITSLVADLDTPIRKLKNSTNIKSLGALWIMIWDQTAPLFMSQHIRKTVLGSIILFITFFSAHGVYMWFPYILNNVMLYVEQSQEPRYLCDMLRYTQSSNFSTMQDHSMNSCVTKLEISTYTHTLVLELIYVSLLLCVIYANRKFDRVRILFIILGATGVCGILSLLTTVPLLAIYLFVIMLCCGLGTSVMNTILVDIYPTNLRAMAVCISLMLGRIGSVVGSNALGALIETHCEEALYSSAISLIIAGCLGLLMPKPAKSLKDAEIIESGTQ